MQTIPHKANLREELHGVGENAKRMIDHIVRAACLLFADRDRANEQSEVSGRVVTLAKGEKPLTLDELAARLGRNKRTIQEWERDFGLPLLRAHSKADPLFDWREVRCWGAMEQ